jgi:ribose-phosphate pyrophosphokinase
MFIYTLGTHPVLEKQIIKKTGFEPGSFFEKTFRNGEYYLKIDQDVRGKKVVVFSVITQPQEQIMKILFLLNAIKSNKASKIVLVLPYYPYSRQDRVREAGEPISAGLMAGLFASAGADRIITIDIHNPQGLGKYKKKVKNIKPFDMLSASINQAIDSSWVLGAPDKGAEKRVRELAKVLNVKKIAYLRKERPQPGKARVTGITGDPVSGEKVLLVDDMIDSGNTIIEAANFIRNRGAKVISVVCTHGIFSQGAWLRLNQSVIKNVYCTDTMPIDSKSSGKLIIIPSADLLARSIKKNV